MISYLPTLQQYTMFAVSMYCTYMVAVHLFNRISWWYQDRKWLNELQAAEEAVVEKKTSKKNA